MKTEKNFIPLTPYFHLLMIIKCFLKMYIAFLQKDLNYCHRKFYIYFVINIFINCIFEKMKNLKFINILTNSIYSLGIKKKLKFFNKNGVLSTSQ